MRADHTRSEIEALDSQHVDGWASWYPVPRSIREGYTHIIRSIEDPERSLRPKGGREDRAPHLTMKRQPRRELERQMLKHLSDGRARTLNRLAVELWDQNACTVFSTQVNDILWDLVERGEIEHTMHAPIRFRKVRR